MAALPYALPLSTCHACAEVTSSPAMLTKVTRSLYVGRSAEVLLCPRCLARRADRRRAWSFLANVAAAGMITFVLSDAFRGGNRDATLDLVLAGLTFAFVGAAMIAPHEFAHALSAKALGLDVISVRLGCGKQLAQFSFAGLPVEVRLIPAVGTCTYALRGDAPPARWRLALSVLAGPAVHFLAAALVLWACWPAVLHPFDNARMLAPAVFAGMNVLLGVTNLFPFKTHANGTTVHSDGLWLLTLARNPAKATGWLTSVQPDLAMRHLSASQPAQARAAMEAARRLAGDSLALRITELAVLASEGKWDQVASRSRTSADANLAEQHAFLVWGAVAAVYRGDPDLTEADMRVDAAMRMAPWDASTLIAGAVVAAAQGRPTEAQRLLVKAGTDGASHSARVADARAWAEIYRQRNDEPQRQTWEHRAAKLDPQGHFRVPQPGRGKPVDAIVFPTSSNPPPVA